MLVKYSIPEIRSSPNAGLLLLLSYATLEQCFFVTVWRNELQDYSEDKSNACMSQCCFTLHCVCVYAITERDSQYTKTEKDNNVWS